MLRKAFLVVAVENLTFKQQTASNAKRCEDAAGTFTSHLDLVFKSTIRMCLAADAWLEKLPASQSLLNMRRCLPYEPYAYFVAFEEPRR